MEQEIINSNEWPNVFSCRFLEDGIVSYKDQDAGIAYLSNEAIRKMSNSFIGKPVCINHQKITAQNYEELRQKGVIVGNVSRVWYNSSDGWWWADFIVDSQKARDRINHNKDKVSCAYTVKKTKDGGLWHDIPFDAEITDGEFTHLAIVENPRYEGAIITKQLPELVMNEKAAYILNNREDTDMLEFFKKKTDGTKEKINSVVVMKNDKGEDQEFNLADILIALNEKIERGVLIESPEPMKGVHAKAGDDLVDINGHTYKVNEIAAMLASKGEKKNCGCNAKEGEAHKEGCEMYQKKNASEEEKMKEEEAKKENDRLNAKAKEIGITVDDVKTLEAAEALNTKLGKDKATLGKKFFNSLEMLAGLSNMGGREEGMGAQVAPRTRGERAAAKKEQVAKHFAGR